MVSLHHLNQALKSVCWGGRSATPRWTVMSPSRSTLLEKRNPNIRNGSFLQGVVAWALLCACTVQGVPSYRQVPASDSVETCSVACPWRPLEGKDAAWMVPWVPRSLCGIGWLQLLLRMEGCEKCVAVTMYGGVWVYYDINRNCTIKRESYSLWGVGTDFFLPWKNLFLYPALLQ